MIKCFLQILYWFVEVILVVESVFGNRPPNSEVLYNDTVFNINQDSSAVTAS